MYKVDIYEDYPRNTVEVRVIEVVDGRRFAVQALPDGFFEYVQVQPGEEISPYAVFELSVWDAIRKQVLSRELSKPAHLTPLVSVESTDITPRLLDIIEALANAKA